MAVRLTARDPHPFRLDRWVAITDQLIARRAGPNRRCVCLVLLRAGIAELEITNAVLDELDAVVLSQLTAAEVRTFERLLAKITDGLVADEQAA